MATKIRLARHGRKKKPFYHIVVADSRAPRDGRYIEKLGSYNPNTNPATIKLDFDGSVDWMMKGAVPTDTAKAILSHEGSLLMVHLKKGVLKGALTEEQAQAKFDAWKAEKAQLVENKVLGLKDAKKAKAKAAMEAEVSRRQTIQERVDAKMTPPVKEASETEEVVEEAQVAETEEAPAGEVEEAAPIAEKTAEATEEPASEDNKEA